MIWAGISLNLLHILANGTITAGMKSSMPLSDLTLMQWALGSPWWMMMSGLMWPKCIGSFWMIPLTGPHIPQSWIQLRTSVGEAWATKEQQRLSRRPLRPYPGLGADPQDNIHHLIRNMPRWCECIQACGGHINYWLASRVAVQKFIKVSMDQLLIIMFYLDFCCGFECSCHWVDDFGFYWHINLFSMNYTMNISKNFNLNIFN